MDVAQVRLETAGDIDDTKSAVEVGDFEGSSGQLLLELLLSGAAFIQFLAGVEGAVVDGGDESIGDGVDGFVDIGVHTEEYFSCMGG